MSTASEKASHPIVNFYRSYADALYEDPLFRKQILHCPFVKRDATWSEKEFFRTVLDTYLDEAQLTLLLINDLHFSKHDALLEIGGGLGLVYGFLKKQGYDVWAIEPCDSGFEGYFGAAVELFKIIGVDGSHFQPLLAKEVTTLDRQFDIIFSNNVLEHIPELEASIRALKDALKPRGVMIHNTVNYFIPYEPHFKMLLVPFFPRRTELFRPRLKSSDLWNGLHFITTRSLRKLCATNGLKIDFKKDRLVKTFMRLDTDPGFAQRQKYFIPFYRFLKFTRLIRLLDKIPIACTTPITCTMKKVT